MMRHAKEAGPYLPDEAATLAAGAALAEALPVTGAVVYLQGDLGAGKTTLVRGLLRALGYAGRVVSPTYTLVEPYSVGQRQVFHLDLYRVQDADELAFLGLRDLDPSTDLILVEWPRQMEGELPAPDLLLSLSDTPEGIGRQLNGQGETATGRACWQSFLGKYSQAT